MARAQTGCHTECGRRPVNQDAVLAVRLSDGRELVAVADGMGGHSAGEVASQRALETVWLRLKAGLDLRSAVIAANADVHAAAAGNPAWRGMGTTLVALLRAGTSYQIANVGDSRAYRITASAVSQITTDHSLMAEAVRDGTMATDEAVPGRWRNALTRALGTDAEVDVDVYGPFDVSEPHAVLLCSDGLHRSMSDDALRGLARAADPWAAARSLAAEAYRNGSSDNISAAVILLGDSDAPRSRVVPPAEPRQETPRRRRRSRRGRRTDILLAVTIALLLIVVAFLVRAW